MFCGWVADDPLVDLVCTWHINKNLLAQMTKENNSINQSINQSINFIPRITIYKENLRIGIVQNSEMLLTLLIDKSCTDPQKLQ